MTRIDRSSTLTRRGYLAVSASVGVSLFAGKGGAAISTDYTWEDGGDDISRRFDEGELLEYLPRFDLSRDARDQLLDVYGWIGESSDHDTDAYYYWMRYSHQEPASEDLNLLDRALGAFASDAHLWDHEPSIVFVDDNGSVEEAIVTGYHHYPLEVSGPAIPLTSDETTQQTHLELEVVDPWHHYRLNHDEDGADVTNSVSLKDFIEVRDTWETRGIFDQSSRLAVDNPWAIKDGRAESWWAEGSRDARAVWLWDRIGARGATDTDPELRGP